jgi:DNA-binding MarR family transcriptional regulator
MSKLVRGLERDRLVTREAHERDGRAVLLRASGAGRRILEEGRERRISELLALFDGLGPDEVETLGEAAAIVEAALARLHPPEVRMLKVPRKGGGPA